MYSDFYGLTAPPFQLTPDPRFWFESGTHKKAMAYLGYGLAQGEGFIVVTGEVGAGKTTLVGHLMASIDPNRLHVVTIVSTQVEGDDMLRLAAQALGLATDGVAKAQLLARIESHLIETGRTGRRTLLVVDEAQNLGITALEELRMLSNFQAGGQALLQIFLLGQPEFRDRLASPALEQMRQRVIATHHLDPMLAGETLAYIDHRLKTVGWTGNPHVTDAAAVALHAASDGIPRRLNTLATRALLMGSIEGATVIDDDLVARMLADQAREAPQIASPAPPIASNAAPSLAQTPVFPFSDPQTVPLAPHSTDPELLDHAARLAAIEAQLHEQEAALRRVLTLLIDWVELDHPMAARAPAA